MATTDNSSLIRARFLMVPVKDEGKSKTEGRPIYNDVEHCEIRFAGDKLRVHVAPAHEVFEHRRDPITQEMEPMTYAIAYPEQYTAFKRNETQEQSGTPLKEVTFLSPGKVLELRALNIHTVETLAALDGQPLKQLGMNGRDLKTQAIAYLETANKTGDMTQVLERLAALEAENAALRNAPGVAAPAAAVESEAVVTTSPFAGWESDDLKNWIEGQTGERPKGNPSVATLIARADEINKKLTEKAAA